MSRIDEPLPAFRPDVEVLHQAAPGRPERRIVREPSSRAVIEISDKEAFIVERLDGRSTAGAIRDQFRAFFGLDLSIDHLRAFVRQLEDNGLLVTSAGVADVSPWQTMKPLWTGTDDAFRRAASALRGLFARTALWIYGLAALLAALVLFHYGNTIAYEVANLWTTVQVIAQPGGFPPSAILRVFLILVALPFLRELVKGTICSLRGLRVPEVRYEWFMRIIPRCGSDVGHIFRLPKSDRLRVVASGLLAEVVILALAVLVWEIVQADNPVKSIAFSVAVAAAVSLLFNGSPFGQQDGGMLVALWANEIDLRRRSIRMWRAWLRRQPMPEAMEAGRQRRFVLYGFLCDAWTFVINLAVLGLVGYLLTGWLGGLGAALFGVLLMLRFEDSIRGAFLGIVGARRMAGTSKSGKASWLPWVIVAVVILLLCVIPYPYDIGGEFRVQSGQQREVRAEVQAQIESIPVAEGASVKAGDVIVQLSARQTQRELEESRAALRREEEILKRLEAGARAEEITVAEQRVALAKTTSDHSAREYDRANDLYEKQHITPDEYEQAMKRRDVDAQAYALAKSDLDLLKAGARAEDIAAQRAEVDRLTVAVKHLEGDLDRLTVRAPIDGQVTTLFLQGKVGQRVNVGDVLAVVQDTSRAVIRIALPEQYAGDLADDAELRARAWAFPGTVFKGRVTGTAATVVGKTEDVLKQAAIEQEGGVVRNLDMPQQNVLPVMAEIDDPEGLLRSDMTGYAKIRAGARPIGYAFFNPVLRFFQVRVWSWIP